MRRFRTVSAILGALAALALGAIPPTFAAFTTGTENSGNVVAAADDFRPPEVTALAIGKSAGGAGGFVKQGGGYFVYASVAADAGKPASGIASVAADAHDLTAGATEVPLVAGSFSLDGVSYDYRSAALDAGAGLAAGAKPFTVTATDNALNAGSTTGTVTVDNTPPTAADVQTANAGVNGRAEQGDSLALTFSEPVEPESILAGWNGAATPVVVRLVDNGLLALPLGNDAVQVYDSGNSTVLPLGTVDLGRGDYVAGLLGGNVRFGIGATASTMTMSGNTVTIVFGTYSRTSILGSERTTAGGAGTMAWTPVAMPFDRAANATSTAPASESGGADREF